MEPHAALAQVDIYGNVVAWSNTQTAYSVKTKLARLLEVPSHKVRVVVPPHIGGGFGSKTRIKSEGIAAVLSKACLKPVKVVCTREEVFSDTTVKHPFVIYIKDGVKKDGTLVAREIKEILDAGAYTEGTVGAYVTRNSAYGAVGVYSTPNFKLDNYRIYTNKPVGGAFRGFGVAQTTWAVESQMDILAEMLKMEPIEFRLKNMLKDGDLNPEGYKMHAVGSRQSLLKAAEDIEWGAAPKNGTNGNGNGSVVRGKGIAVGCKHFSIQSSSAALRIAEDESLEIRSRVTDLGQGSRTIMAQIAAEEFNIPLEKVRLVTVDTDVTPYDTGQSGSSTTFKAGHAVRLACKDAKRKLFERASEALEARADDLETKGGQIYVKGSPEKEIRIGELFKRIPINGPGFDHGPFLEEGADIIGDATFYPANETNPQGEALPMVGFSYCSQACEIEIDTATGRIKILKFVSILDPGKPLNTELVKGQIEGGVGTGIGTALMEEMQFSSDGRLTNGNLTDYRIPTSLDFPEGDNVILDIVETDYQNGPYGAKGIGEVVLCATAATIASAIYNATGVRIKDMPLTPERVAKALAEHASNGH
jgi:carbon-monoxide dehydrogenase large subunit